MNMMEVIKLFSFNKMFNHRKKSTIPRFWTFRSISNNATVGRIDFLNNSSSTFAEFWNETVLKENKHVVPGSHEDGNWGESLIKSLVREFEFARPWSKYPKKCFYQKNLPHIIRAFDSDCDGSNKSLSFREKWVGLSKSIKDWSFFCRVRKTKILRRTFEKMIFQNVLPYDNKAVRPWRMSSNLPLRITTTLKMSWIRKLEIFH